MEMFFLIFAALAVIAGLLSISFCFYAILKTNNGVEIGLLIIMLIASCILPIAGGMLGVSVISGML